MSDSRLQLLRDMPVFGGVTANTLDILLQSAPVICVSKGDYFFREGDSALSMFVLEKGQVAILKSWNDHLYRLRSLGRGDCFGEMALIDLFPRSASVMADEDSTAIELSSAMLYEISKRDLEQFTIIQMNIARELSRRLRVADERLFQSLAETEWIDESLAIST
jgi:CRP/FNR family cyclic AMP-dependent transcriptional regulator